MGFLGNLRPLGNLFAQRSRRGSMGRTRAHVEFRDLGAQELKAFASRIELAAEVMPKIRWVEVNAHTKRVVFAFEEGAYQLYDLLEIVDAAESAAGLAHIGYDERNETYPDDPEEGVRRTIELAADAVSMAAGFALWLSPIPAVPFSGNIVATLSVIRSWDRLRFPIEERLGVDRANFLLNLTVSTTQAMAQRPFSAFVDGAHKTALLREYLSRRHAWHNREEELYALPDKLLVGTSDSNRRPVPLPRGPIEEYSDRAWIISLSGFSLNFLATRSIQRAMGALFGSFPTPAQVGRDVFCAELASLLSQRGTLVMSPRILRQLDRIDCILLEGDLFARPSFVVAGLHVDDPDATSDARKRSEDMFDPAHPLALQTDGLWKLGPWRLSTASCDKGLTDHAMVRSESGALVLALERADRVTAIVEIEILPRIGVEELVAAAHEAEIRVVVSGAEENAVQALHVDEVISESDSALAGLQRLQKRGYGVAYIGNRDTEALRAADCGIGIYAQELPTPWGAHLLIRNNLDDVRFLINAIASARRVSKQCVNIALGSATLAALVSAGGLLRLTTQRVLFVVNAASSVAMLNSIRHTFELNQQEVIAPRDPTPWHALEASGVLNRLGTRESGLSSHEANLRKRPNKSVQRKPVTELLEAISDELFNPLAPVLAAGAGLSAVVGAVADAGVVAGVVGVNAIVGGVQRYRTEQRIRGLSEEKAVLARVRRNDQLIVIDASELVQGDIVYLSRGDIVPADCRILSPQLLEIDASTLTGESLPVAKSAFSSFETHIADRGSMVYAGTTVSSGKTSAVVVAVGDATEARRGSTVAKNQRAKGGVEIRLRELMDLTTPIAIGAGVGVIGVGLLRGRKLSDLVNTGVSLAVASVPEGLPLLASAAQLAAAERLGKRGVIVRNIRSIEALGRVSVLAIDKTGTLTEGLMRLHSLHDGQKEVILSEIHHGSQLEACHISLMQTALRATPPIPLEGGEDDTTDAAFRIGASQFGIQTGTVDVSWQLLSEIEFDSDRSYHASLGQFGLAKEIALKGAPETVLPTCSKQFLDGKLVELSSDDRFLLAARAARLARKGLRVLAVAKKPHTHPSEHLESSDLSGMIFEGFMALRDPLRKEAKASLQELLALGVTPVVLTGDHPSTAKSIAEDLGLLSDRIVLSGADLTEMSDPELESRLGDVAVFARVTPAQKVRIVRAYQRAGKAVAMAGDGANDAPALRLADVGIALGQDCTAAARSASDIILIKPDVSRLIAAVLEGRTMWASVREAVAILMGGNLGEIGFTVIAGMIDGRPPLNARQLLLVNLLTDVAPAMAIALRAPERGEAMQIETPEEALGPALTREIAERAGLTALGAGSAWAVARIIGSRKGASTVGLAALVGTQLGQTLRAGQHDKKVVLTAVGSAALLAAMIQTPGVSQFFGCRPIGPVGWGIAAGASTFATFLPDLFELVRSPDLDHQAPIGKAASPPSLPPDAIDVEFESVDLPAT